MSLSAEVKELFEQNEDEVIPIVVTGESLKALDTHNIVGDASEQRSACQVSGVPERDRGALPRRMHT